ncbi:UPF0291 protein like [Actinidia chinensis var. chinensis]|uniref:UPF0291 protein like n=1 Tax=Actinidia chinensis var. chinensis TaxID=1590841 RepID=A0A2R6PFT5_ACTCC|nr:UPF0291 protein like [Actinidia chinensis var. chinensis]
MDQSKDASSKISSTTSDTENEAERRRRTGKAAVAEDERVDINKLAEDFIKNFRNQLKIQERAGTSQNTKETLTRGH